MRIIVILIIIGIGIWVVHNDSNGVQVYQSPTNSSSVHQWKSIENLQASEPTIPAKVKLKNPIPANPSGDFTATLRRILVDKKISMALPNTDQPKPDKTNYLKAFESYTERLQQIPPLERSYYWQAGCGPFSVGRVHQGRKSFAVLAASMNVPKCSLQQGEYTSYSPIRSNLSLDATFGAAGKVVNSSLLSYDSAGIHYFYKDGLKASSRGEGTPQFGISLNVIVPTN